MATWQHLVWEGIKNVTRQRVRDAWAYHPWLQRLRAHPAFRWVWGRKWARVAALVSLAALAVAVVGLYLIALFLAALVVAVLAVPVLAILLLWYVVRGRSGSAGPRVGATPPSKMVITVARCRECGWSGVVDDPEATTFRCPDCGKRGAV